MKKGNIIAIILLILSIFGIGVFLILPIMSILILLASTASNPSMGIIGGADRPTVIMVASSVFGNIFYFVGAAVSVIVFVVSIIYLVKNNSKKDKAQSLK